MSWETQGKEIAYSNFKGAIKRPAQTDQPFEYKSMSINQLIFHNTRIGDQFAFLVEGADHVYTGSHIIHDDRHDR